MATKKLQILDSLIKQAENANTLDGKHASDFLNTITLTTVFDENFNVLVTTDATTIPKDFATDYKDNAKYVFIPFSVTRVEAGAFYYCTNITDVFIDNIRGGILFMSLENVDTNSSISAFPASTNLHYVKGSNTLQGLLSQINAKSDKFTTLSGYGITDAYTKNEVDTALLGKLDNTTGSVVTDNIADGAVTEAKFANGAISEPKLEAKLLSKLSYVTPQMYGAVGDGVTDDTDAIQSAMNYVTANGGSLRFPGGTTYIISKPIQIITYQKSFEIDFGYSTITCGSEFNSDTINSEEVNSAFYIYTNSTNQKRIGTIKNLIIDGKYENIHTGLYLKLSSKIYYENINLIDVRRGIYFKKGVESFFDNIHMSRSSGIDITSDIDLETTDCIGIDCYATDNHFSNIIVIDFVIGMNFRLGSGDNRVYGAHVWNYYCKTQYKKSVCFMNSGSNFYTNCVADHFFVGWYIYGAGAMYLNGCNITCKLVKDNSNNIIPLNSYAFYFGDSNAKNRIGSDIIVDNTRINGEANDYNESVTLTFSNISDCNINYSGVAQNCEKAPVPNMPVMVSGKTVIDDANNSKINQYGGIKSVEKVLEFEECSTDFSDITDKIYTSGGWPSNYLYVASKTSVTISGNSAEVLSASGATGYNYLNLYLSDKDGDKPRTLGLKNGDLIMISYKYKTNSSSKVAHVPSASLTPYTNDDTVLSLTGDGAWHNVYRFFTVSNATSAKIAFGDYNTVDLDNALYLTDIRVINLSKYNIPKYYLETDKAYRARLIKLFGTTYATSVTIPARNDVSFASIPYKFSCTDISSESDQMIGFSSLGKPIILTRTSDYKFNYIYNNDTPSSITFELSKYTIDQSGAIDTNRIEVYIDNTKIYMSTNSTPGLYNWSYTKNIVVPSGSTLKLVFIIPAGKDCMFSKLVINPYNLSNIPIIDAKDGYSKIPLYANGEICLVAKNKCGADLPTAYFEVIYSKPYYILTDTDKAEIANAALEDINTTLSGKADKATTLAGYSITDAYTKTEVDNELAAKSDLVQSKNIFDFDTWAKGLQNLKKPIYNGTLDVVDFDEKSITFTSTGTSTFTNGWVDEPAEMRIAVKSNTVYTFSWLFENSTNNRIFLFFNGQNTAETRLTEVGSKAFLTFTTPEDASYITIRFDSYNQNIAAKVSNIMIEEGDKKSLYLPYEVAKGVKELAQSTESAITEVDTALSGKLDNTTGSVKTDNIASKAVTNEKIANGAITALKLAIGAVSGNNIAQNQISTDHLQNGAVTNDKIANGAISEPKLEAKLLSKLSYVTPQMYGAKGDGISDDTSAVQAALNTGQSVYIPKGVYKVGKLIISNGKGARIYGDGCGNTILKHNDAYISDDCVIQISDDSNCILSSFSIFGGGSDIIDDGTYTGTKYHGIIISNCSNNSENVIENIDIYKCLGDGLHLLNSAIGCRISNIHTYYNVGCGLYNEGYGNKVVNLDTHQNHSDGICIWAGGFNGTNIKSWGNLRDGINMDNMWSHIAAVVLYNVSVQQNGRHGLMMTNCESCVITGLQSLANNYKSKSKLNDGETLYSKTAGLLMVDGNHNNYIQGNITSSYAYWNSFEENSVRIAGKDNTNNIIDLTVNSSLMGPDMYEVCFKPLSYTDSDGNNHNLYNYNKLPEYSILRQTYSNPLNTIKINGEVVSDKTMTNVANNNIYSESFMKKSDGTTNVISVSSDISSGILSLTLSDYADLPAKTIDNITYDTGNIDVGKLAYRRGYSLPIIKGNANKVLYLRLTAKVSEYKAFGIIPLVHIMYKADDGTTKYAYLDISADYIKSNIIFNTDYITKNIALDLGDYVGKDITIYLRLCATKLSDKTISNVAIQDTATIDIKEFSYKLC